MTEKHLQQLSIDVGAALKAAGLWVTCAESCTGGWVAKAITDVAGSSAWFDRGFVTYSNAAKRELLDVSDSTLKEFGAVSEQVVREMARGARYAAGADVAVSISGIAPYGLDLPTKMVGFMHANRFFPEIAKPYVCKLLFSRYKPYSTSF
jgi:nicotinamide-nucleotide amidase